MITTIWMVGNIGMMLAETLTDLDSHADQCVLGNNTLVVYNYEKATCEYSRVQSQRSRNSVWLWKH
jgi:hypothetical protein